MHIRLCLCSACATFFFFFFNFMEKCAGKGPFAEASLWLRRYCPSPRISGEYRCTCNTDCTCCRIHTPVLISLFKAPPSTTAPGCVSSRPQWSALIRSTPRFTAAAPSRTGLSRCDTRLRRTRRINNARLPQPYSGLTTIIVFNVIMSTLSRVT